jgi:hypothetical protein
VGATYGRFVVDEDAECMRLRVQSADSVILWRAAALAGVGFIVFLPTMAFSGPLMAALSAVLCFFLLGSSMAMASRAGVARSSYPRVRRLIEVHGKEGASTGTSACEMGNALLVVDGKSFARADVVGVVVAKSTEAVRMSGKVARKVSRYRPTLLLRESAFELDVMEADDEPHARELADAVASAIAQRRTEAPEVPWDAPHYVVPSLPWSLVEALEVAGFLLGGAYVTLAHPSAAWMVSVGFVLLVLSDEGSIRAMTRSLARERTRKCEQLLAHAKTALRHAA